MDISAHALTHADRPVTIKQMQDIDKAAINIGIPRLLLMDHAGLAVARSAALICPNKDSLIVVCCGMGFNGGDGLSAARHLCALGYSTRVVLTGQAINLREEPAIYAKILKNLHIPFKECSTIDSLSAIEPWLADCSLIIDALIGIGGSNPRVREPIASLIDRINHAGKPVVAVDIPSGLDANTGAVLGSTITATVTVTFGQPKHGCLINQGPKHSGSVIVDPITIPPILLRKIYQLENTT